MSDSEPHDPEPHAAAASHGRAVPLLLAVAAVFAAVVTARATLLASDATILWVRSVGEEQRRGAQLTEAARYAYSSEGAVGFMVLSAEVRQEELQAMSEGQPPATASRLATEVQVQQTLIDLFGADAPLVTDPRYRLPSGALDLELRLADARAEDPEALAIDPMATLEEGDAAAERSDLLMLTTIVIAAAFLFGALAQAFRGHRRPLLVLGWIVLVAGGALAVAVELGILAGYA